jgi:hypothetical protein
MAEQIILAGGGGSFPEQQQVFIPEVRVEVVQPTDNTLLLISGIVVPLLIFGLGIYLNKRKGNAHR